MKFIRTIFNRASIISFLIIFQVILFCLVVSYFSAYFGYIYIMVSILSSIFVLFVANQDKDPTGKMPWLFVIIAIPPIGALIYLMYSDNKPKKKHKILYQQLFESCKKYIRQDENVLKNFDDKLLFSQSKYIHNVSYSPAWCNTQTIYLSSGEEFFKQLQIELKKAKHFIFLEYFIIQKGKMWDSILDILKQKVSQGVDVRLIYDDFGTIYRLPNNYAKKLQKIGIKTYKFNKFKPILSSIHNNRDHRKLAIIDNYVAFTGGINLADEYINQAKRFGHWKDSGIMIKGDAVTNFTLLFLQNFIVLSGKIENFNKFVLPNVSSTVQNGVVQPFADGPHPLYTERIGETIYQNILNQAKKYVYITTPYLIVDFNFITALKMASKRGVDVRIITPHIPDKKIVFLQTQSSYKPLIEAGIKIYEYTPGFIHSKTFIADDEVGVVSTINLDYRSFVHHYECGVWLYKTDCLKDIKYDFETTLTKCKKIKKGNYHFGPIKKLCAAVIGLFAPLM